MEQKNPKSVLSLQNAQRNTTNYPVKVNSLCPRLWSNGARSPEATNIQLRATEKKFPVVRPGTLASGAVFSQAGRKI